MEKSFENSDEMAIKNFKEEDEKSDYQTSRSAASNDRTLELRNI